MKKLEDISKQNIFKTPEGYFEALPQKIQKRLVIEEADTSPSNIWRVLKFAVPLFVAAIIVFAYIQYKREPDSSDLLSSISTEELITYLQEDDLATEDLLDNTDFTSSELDSLERKMFDDSEVEYLMNEQTDTLTLSL